MRIDINADRLNRNLLNAADYLGERILQDCTKFVPKREGILRNSGYVDASGTMGEVVWDQSYAHYQYEAILYVEEKSGSAWARKGENKVPAVPEKKLTHYTTKGTGGHWFEEAEKQFGDDWIKEVKKRAGG